MCFSDDFEKFCNRKTFKNKLECLFLSNGVNRVNRVNRLYALKSQLTLTLIGFYRRCLLCMLPRFCRNSICGSNSNIFHENFDIDLEEGQ